MKKIDWLNNWKTFVQGTFPVSDAVAQFIVCQFALESNFGQSDIFRENNNICGMKLPKYRITCAQTANRGHATYLNVEDSIWDYFIWLCYYGFSRRHLENYELFISHFRKTPYCPQFDYIERIVSLKTQFYGL